MFCYFGGADRKSSTIKNSGPYLCMVRVMNDRERLRKRERDRYLGGFAETEVLL